MPGDSKSLRVLMLNGDLRGVASFWRCYHLARELVRLGQRVCVVTVSRARRIRPKTEVRDGFTLIESPNLLDLVYGLGSGYGLLGLPYRMVAVARERFDVVHAFEHRPNVLLPAMLSRALHSCPLVADWADWWGFTGDRSGSRENMRWPVPSIETAAEEFIHRKADYVTTISTVMRNRALSLGIPAERLRCIPSGAPTEDIHVADKESCRREIGIPPTTFLLGYVGSDTRDLDMIAPALPALRQTHPQLRLGVMSPKSLPFRVPGAEDAVIRFGSVPFSRLSAYLGACDAFVLPQRDTMFNRARWPNKSGDYLAAGRPILCSNVGDISAIIHAEGCGLIWKDIPGFLQGIETLMDDPRLASEMGERARALAEGRLSWRELTPQFLDVYASVSGRV